jgi:hypothetical protein
MREVKTMPRYKEIANSHAVYNARIPGWKSRGENCHSMNNHGQGAPVSDPAR